MEYPFDYQSLLGKKYLLGTSDCYSLIREFYRSNFGLQMRNYARPDWWWQEDLNLYYENFRKEGFESADIPISEIEVGDGLLMSFSSKFPNHAGVYVGNNRVLHHFYNNLSGTDPLRTGIRNSVTAVLRNKKVYNQVKEYQQNHTQLIDVRSLKKGRNGYDIVE
jgi:cell wall-associated NlpC family hydrolase